MSGARREDAGAGWKFLVLAGCAQLALLAAAGWWPGAALPVPVLPCLVLAFVVYLAAGVNLPDPSPSASPRGESVGPDAAAGGRITGTIWLFALLFRAVLIPLEPVLSDDIYRYLWDGHVQLQGINPFLHAPADPALEGIRTEWHPLVNHPEVPTIYPPLAQLFFRAGAWFAMLVGSGILALKLLWIACELIAAYALGRVARATGRNDRRVLLLFLWSPLLIVETAWSGHMEAMGLLWLSLLLWMSLRAGSGEAEPRPLAALGAGVTGAFATLTKFAPGAAFPPLTRRLGLAFAGAFVVTVALLYLPFIGAGTKLFTGLRIYGEHWRANEGLFLLLDFLLPGGRLPRAAAGVLVLGIIGWVTVRRFDAERALFWILGAGLLLTPTLHPWYVLWILPFAVLRGSRSWLVLSGLVFMGYWGAGTYDETGIWPDPPWVRALIWLPFFAILVREGRGVRAEEANRPGKREEPPETHSQIPDGEQEEEWK